MRNINKRLFDAQDATVAVNSAVLRTKLLTRFTATGQATGISAGSGTLKFQQNNKPGVWTMQPAVASDPGWVDVAGASVNVSTNDPFVITLEEISATWLMAVWTPDSGTGPSGGSTFFVDFDGKGFT